ncbi:c-type cytochrome [Thiohalobacter sp.]|uniref:c-type cytochrome n=1 Tax=Thiohalobacter sp. TaxID=2025948 RepID=UPI002638DCB2|nr:cytochrome c [Thiohalobacter sp.]
MRFTSATLLLVIPLTAFPAPDAARQAALRTLVAQDCGSCHGLTLKGGLGPALTPDALAGKPDTLLLSTVLDGRPGTAMPPWRPFLSEAEARWIIDQLRAGEIRP